LICHRSHMPSSTFGVPVEEKYLCLQFSFNYSFMHYSAVSVSSYIYLYIMRIK
jgi:hypothetical protein